MMKRIDKGTLTEADKAEKLARGEYIFKAPPVCSAGWNDNSWIKFIDSYNGWTERKKES